MPRLVYHHWVKERLAVILVLLFFAVGFIVSFSLFGPLPRLQQENLSRTVGQLDEKPLRAAAWVAAVKGDGVGVLNRAEVEIQKGRGRVLINTNPFIEPDTQQSLEVAARVASNITGYSLADRDVVYSVSQTDAQLIGGPSAGSIFAVATIAAMTNRTVRDDAVMTGAVLPDGTMTQVGGIIEKINAAQSGGAKVFVIPKGQRVTYYERVVVGRTIYLQPRLLNITEYGQEHGIRVVEVGSVSEAVPLLLA
jgi:uncharacterized protein